jgi:REP element-mobilizing transposase RayT
MVFTRMARDIVLRSCLHEHERTIDLDVAVVMPDHAHLIFTPRINFAASSTYPLAEITKAVKGASSHLINRRLGTHQRIWQEESFDHVLRASEKLREKIEYVINNPVRKGLVANSIDYPWSWSAPPKTT